jgi:hypothetical protein
MESSETTCISMETNDNHRKKKEEEIWVLKQAAHPTGGWPKPSLEMCFYSSAGQKNGLIDSAFF